MGFAWLLAALRLRNYFLCVPKVYPCESPRKAAAAIEATVAVVVVVVVE